MFHILKVAWVGVLALLAITSAQAQEVKPSFNFSNNQLSVELIVDQHPLKAGDTFKVGARFRMKPNWHIYYKDPGEVGLATQVEFSSPSKVTFSELLWKKPMRYEDQDISYGYSGETVIASTAKVSSSESGAVALIKARIQWLACNSICIPGKADLEITVPIVSAGSAVARQNTEHFEGLGYKGNLRDLDTSPQTSVFDNLEVQSPASQSLWQFLLFAFLGGIILNVMPCVLPVVSIKLMQFVKESGEDRSKLFILTCAYAAGTITTCVLLGLAVVIAQYAGASVGWGFQFQQPWFLVGMACLLTVMALSMLGMFFIQVSTGGKLDSLSRQSGLAGSFFTGVVATILSTPCTAPYLGSAIGFAFAQSWWVTLAVFFTIGLGLAAPYLVLGVNPAWKRFIPKPGIWMEYFKQAMGFILLGSVIWLLYVLGRMIGSDGVVGTMALLVTVGFATWLINTFAHPDATRNRKLSIWTLSAVLVALPGWFMVAPAISYQQEMRVATVEVSGPKIFWLKFSKNAVEGQLKNNQVVFIDFTAQWCQTCKLNEYRVLEKQGVVQKFKDLNIAAFKADWTFNDPEITEVLKKFGRSGVPFYVIFDPRQPDSPIVLSELLTVNGVIEALEKATGPLSLTEKQ